MNLINTAPLLLLKIISLTAMKWSSPSFSLFISIPLSSVLLSLLYWLFFFSTVLIVEVSGLHTGSLSPFSTLLGLLHMHIFVCVMCPGSDDLFQHSHLVSWHFMLMTPKSQMLALTSPLKSRIIYSTTYSKSLLNAINGFLETAPLSEMTHNKTSFTRG